MSFRVPEVARWCDAPGGYASTSADGNNGAFRIDSPEPGWKLAFICSDGEGWEHVSVHAFRKEGKQQRTPSWREMVFVKDLCWDGDDIVVQFHPRKQDYVNCHPYTLHLWRPIDATMPAPPSILVGRNTDVPIDPTDQRAVDEFLKTVKVL